MTSVLAPEGDGHWSEYPGGYSDMLEQRKGLEPEKALSANGDAPGRRLTQSQGTAAAPAPPKPARKLSFKEKHALETLPGQIRKFEAEIKVLADKLSDATLFTRNRTEFDATSARLTTSQTALEKAETAWLELEQLRSEIEGAA